MYSAIWWLSVLGGFGLLGVAAYELVATPLDSAAAQLGMMTILVLVLELRPLVQGRGHDPHGVVMSTAFVFAMLYLWGLWPAVAAVSLATLCSGLRQGKALWKHLFNIGQYNLCLAGAWLVLVLAGHHPSIQQPLRVLRGEDLWWVLGASVVYFLLNDILVSAALAWTESFAAMIRYDFLHYATTTFSVLALSPLIVVVAQTAWTLLPLLLIPLLLVYKMAQMSLEREFQADHDALTGLPNRNNLVMSLEEALESAQRDGKPFGLLLIDMDRFKEVNDTLGHHVGDKLLIQFARRLAASIRAEDQPARLGGDEFAVIVAPADVTTALSIGERIQAALSLPVYLDGVTLDIRASIGVAMYPADAEAADDLLRVADVAMYVAKKTPGRIATYAAARDHSSSAQTALVGQLRDALTDGALDLYYQPKVSLADGSVLGVEALARWRHPTRGLIPPEEFIPIAEHSGVMPALTERVISMALKQAAHWRDLGLQVRVAVNISPTDLSSGNLIPAIVASLRTFALSANLLQLEVTERVLCDDAPNLDRVLAGLDNLGVTLSLDDFGTGYSSLLRLKSLPVRELKIGNGFIAALATDTATIGFVRTIIELAHVLDIPAIAEEVETGEQLDALRKLGCDGVQGWLIAAPMPPADMTAWLCAWDQRELATRGQAVPALSAGDSGPHTAP